MTMLKKINNESYLNRIYIIAFCIQVIVFFLRTTLIGSDYLGRINIIFGRTCTLFVYISIVMILFKIIIEKSTGAFFKLFSIIIFFLTIYIYLKTNYLEVMSTTLLSLGSKKVDYFCTVKRFFQIGTILTIITIVLALTKMIVNVSINKNGVITYSLGFVYPTDFAAHIFTLFLSYYVYKLKDRFSFFGLFITIITTIILFKVTYAKNDVFCMIMLAIFILLYKINFDYFIKLNRCHSVFVIIRFIKNACLRLSSISLFLVSITSLILAYEFKVSSIFFSKINNMLTGRLFYSNEALHLYPINLLGHRIVQNGFGGVNGGMNASHYFFIDQSIVRIFVSYGAILSILFIFGYTIRMVTINKSDYSIIVIPFAIFSLYCFVDFRIYDPSYNFFVPIIFSSLVSPKTYKK